MCDLISFFAVVVVFFFFRVCEFGAGETRPDAKRLFDGVARLISGALWKQSMDLISSRREFLTVVVVCAALVKSRSCLRTRGCSKTNADN